MGGFAAVMNANACAYFDYLTTYSNYWLIDRQTLAEARTEDLKYATPEELGWIAIWLANGDHSAHGSFYEAR